MFLIGTGLLAIALAPLLEGWMQMNPHNFGMMVYDQRAGIETR